MTRMRAVFVGSLVLLGLVACRERARVVVPGPTTARPDEGRVVLSGPATDPRPTTTVAADAGAPAIRVPTQASTTMPSRAASASVALPEVRFAKPGTRVAGGPCTRILVAAARGKVTVETESITGPPPKTTELARNDVLVATHATAVVVRGDTEAIVASGPTQGCAIDDHPLMGQVVVKGTTARELRWAKGAMRAHLDVTPAASPDLYLGRLEGTAPVAEHVHAGSAEILVALEGAGTFTIEGTPTRLVAPRIVVVPAGAKHAWTPDPGTKLVAVQLYGPPGPEQRFVALDAAERDGGAPN